MADLQPTNVVIHRKWEEGGRGRKDTKCLDVTVTITAAGTPTTNQKIKASAFGLKKFLPGQGLITQQNGTSDVHWFIVKPEATSEDADCTLLLHYVPGTNDTPSAITGVFRFVIRGF